MTDPTPPFSVIWDGGRQVAVLPGGAFGDRTVLAAESPRGRVRLLAVGEAGSSAPLAAELPPGTRLIHLAGSDASGSVHSVTLDGAFFPDASEPPVEGTRLVALSCPEDGSLRPAESSDQAASGLNLAGRAGDGSWRVVAGPFADASGQASRIIAVAMTGDAAAPTLSFDAAAELVAISRIAAGGTLHAEAAVATAAGSAVTLRELAPGDAILVIAAGGRLLRMGAGSATPKAEAFILADGGAGWRSHPIGRNAGPSLSTGLAHGGAPSSEGGHGIDGGRLSAALASARAALAAAPLPSPGLALAGALERAASESSPPRAFTATLDEDIAEEVEERPLAEQVMFERWAGMSPNALAQALSLRLLPPATGTGDALASLVRWYGQSSLPSRLARAATTLSATDAATSRALQEFASGWRRLWVSADELAQTKQVLDESGLDGPDSALDALLAGFAEAKPDDLETLARQRSELVENARATGQSEAVLAELGERLASLRPAEIARLHRGFVGLRRRAAQWEAAAALVASWEKASGRGGLSRRVGDERGGLDLALALGDRAGPLAERLPGDLLGRAVSAVTMAAEDAVQTRPADPQDAQLRRSLIGYGCLLLADLARREADAVFAAAGLAEDAAVRRARAGADATLGLYLARAEAVGGRDRIWGAPFITLRREPAA